MAVTLQDPWALLALVPLAALAAAIVAARPPASIRSAACLALPVVAAAALVLALAAPVVRTGSHRSTTLLVDRSASIDGSMRQTERDWLARARARDCPGPCRIVSFAAAPATLKAGGQAPDPDATDLQSGLSAAVGLTPRGGRVVVLSDGGQTTGDVTAAVAAAGRRDVAVDWVALSDRTLRDASITAIHVPAAVHVGDTVPLTLTIHSTVAGPAVLRIARNGGTPGSQTVQLRVGDTPLLLFYTATRQGWNSFTATISEPHDADPANDAGSAVVHVGPPPRVLVVADGSSRAAALLAGRQLQLTTVTPSALPDDAAAYAGDDAVVLDDVDADRLSAAQIAALDDAVRDDGLGALALGGPHSFSLGHYAQSALQQILPVSSLVPGNLQRRNLAIELVLDHSGSMIDLAGGVPKIEMARSGARQTAAFIAAHRDQLGVVDFDIAPHLLVALQRLAPGASQRRVDARIATLQADGGTNIYAGLKAGFAELELSHAKQRHMILMTDGISAPANYEPLLAQIRAAHITVATVALGADADRTLLARIAAGTGGHAYATDNAHDLPQIFVKSTRLSAKPVRVTGHLRVLAAGDSPILRSLAGRQLPGLRGNVVVTLKSGAQADLDATDPHSSSDPALAQWQVGAGRVVAWTAGVGAPWAASWDTEAPMFDDAVRWAERGVVAGTLEPQPTGSSGMLDIDLADAGPAAVGVRQITGTLTGADGAAHRIVFGLVGPARYQADVADLPEGVYTFALTAVGDPALRSSGLVALPYPAERSPVPAAVSPLGQVVTQTDGRMLGLTDLDALVGHRYRLREPLVLIALVLFLAGLVLRLWPGDRDGGGSSGRSAGYVAPDHDAFAGEPEHQIERVDGRLRRHVVDAGGHARRLGLGTKPRVAIRIALA
jgi:Ca-activated chloride channel homolog